MTCLSIASAARYCEVTVSLMFTVVLQTRPTPYQAISRSGVTWISRL